MPNRLKDKTAVITAAGQGIGRAIAELFIAEGAIVIASDIEEPSSRASRRRRTSSSTRARRPTSRRSPSR